MTRLAQSERSEDVGQQMINLTGPRLRQALIDLVRNPQSFANDVLTMDPPDVEAVLQAAALQALGSSAALTLRKAGATVPDWLEAHRLNAAATSMLAMRTLAAIAPVLNEAGVDWAVLKGPVVSAAFDKPEEREFVDLDILVAGGQLETVLEVLGSVGIDDMNKNWEGYLEHGVAEFPVLVLNTAIDLHWHLIALASKRRSFDFDISAMLSRRRAVDIFGHSYPALDPTDHLIHLCVHAGLSGGNRLSWLRDIAATTVKDPPPWDEFIARSRVIGVAPMAGQLLDRTALVLSAPVPEAVRMALVNPSALATRRYADRLHRPLARAKRRLFSGLPVSAARSGFFATALQAMQIAMTITSTRMGFGPSWSAADENGPLYWNRPSGDACVRQRYMDLARSFDSSALSA